MRIPKTRNLLLLTAAIILLLGGWYLWGPVGGSLTSLDNGSFAQFTSQFDDAVGNERVLLLVSPT